MRRLAFLAAASLAFIAISEPLSATQESHMQEACRKRRENEKIEKKLKKCKRACDDTAGVPGYEKWIKCYQGCKNKYPANSTKPNYDPRLAREGERMCGRDYEERDRGSEAAKSKCNSGCYDKIAEKYGRPWRYGDLAPADQQSFLKCTKRCDNP